MINLNFINLPILLVNTTIYTMHTQVIQIILFMHKIRSHMAKVFIYFSFIISDILAVGFVAIEPKVYALLIRDIK